MNPLILKEEDINKISKSASDRKFSMDRPKEIIYYPTDLDLIKNFINSYQFLRILADNIFFTEKQISKKIKDYVKQFDDLYWTCCNFKNRASVESSSMRWRNAMNVHGFLEEYRLKITDFINTIYPLGRVVRLYDPDEAAGIS